VELGTAWRSYELLIHFTISNTSSPLQTVYTLIGLEEVFEYKQYLNCRNGPYSASQRFADLIVKICSYEPIQENVFANFISVNNETANSLIQFYNRSGSSSFPFRVDIIYSNPTSNHDFAIRNDTLVVGSLFNLLCYYAITPTLSWTLSRNNSRPPTKDQTCDATLTLYNKHNSFNKTVSIFCYGG
jgi:hypothetical protein